MINFRTLGGGVLFLVCFAVGTVSWAGQVGTLPDYASKAGLVVGQNYYLGHNLHADNRQSKLSTANFLLSGGLLSWGAEVKITNISRNYLSFTLADNNRRYRYVFHGRTIKAGKLKSHLAHVFVKDIGPVKARYELLSELDKDGIYEGVAKPGMSKVGVLFALGHPPEYVVPKPMKAREWTYWHNRIQKQYITFNRQGRVSLIK